MRARHVGAVAGILGLAPGIGACATSDSRAEDQATQLPGLSATLEQYREDEIQGFISVKTTNGSSSTVQFRDLRLQWPGITNEAPHIRSTQVAPGVTFDIRVRQGDAVCGDPPRPDSAPPDDAAVAVGNASIDGAPPVVVAVPIHDERAILPKVYGRSCQEQRLRWAGELRFGDTWTPSTTATGKPAVLGTIELRRHESDEALTITQINGSVLLRISAVAPSDPVVTLGPDDDTATVPIRIEQSGNCSAHALIESKKTFIIPIGFAVGDDEPTSYVITFDTPTRGLLNEMINDSCGVG